MCNGVMGTVYGYGSGPESAFEVNLENIVLRFFKQIFKDLLDGRMQDLFR